MFLFCIVIELLILNQFTFIYGPGLKVSTWTTVLGLPAL